MPHLLKNNKLEILIDLPLENYNAPRFDWTGKITDVKYQNSSLASKERTDFQQEENKLGKGYYNEFGIEAALGFEETKLGGWFHKIGVGLLKKEDNEYLFNKNYEIQPADFKVYTESKKIIITCTSKIENGYAYFLKKEIELQESGFTINYHLQNTGEKNINTHEYVHNFLAINNDLMGPNYLLKFPFQIKPELFGETVNPAAKVAIGQQQVSFNGMPKEQFFFSNLSGNKPVKAAWELRHLKSKIRIKESGNFQTQKINLWGWGHVISPELFINLFIRPKASTAWTRTYKIDKIKNNK